jgi:hypothetical protein
MEIAMKQWLSVLTAAGLAVAVCCQTAQAGSRRHHESDPRLIATGIAVGAGTTAGFFALRDWRLNGNGRRHGLTTAGAVVATTAACMAISPIVATVAVQRELTFREAYAMTADCLIPFVGAWLVNKAFDAHPEWEPRKVHARR